MNIATIQFAGATATLDSEGEWQCERADVRRALRGIAADHPARHYLPDPYAEQLAAIEADGGTITSRSPLEVAGNAGTGAIY